MGLIHSIGSDIEVIEPAPAFALRNLYCGVDRLPAALTINGTTVLPSLRYKLGPSGNLAPWGYGPTLVLQAGTAPAYNQGSPLPSGRSNDDSVLFPGSGGYWLCAETSSGDITTDDIVFHVLYRHGTNTTKAIVSKRAAAIGWVLFTATAGLSWYIQDAGGNVGLFTSAIVPGAWYDCWAFYDRSGSGIIYTNAVANPVYDISAKSGSLSSANALNIGGTAAFGLALFEMWHAPNWLNLVTPGPDLTEVAALTRAKLALLTGGPTVVCASANPDVMLRTTPSYIDKWESATVRKYWYVGGGWPALHQRKDSAGRYLVGSMPDLARTNKCLQSEDMATTWALVNATDAISANAGAGPDGTAVLDGIVAVAILDVIHGVSQAITLTATTWCISGFARAGNKTWLYVDDTTVANATCYLQLSGAGAVGTKGAGCATAVISEWGVGSGLYRWWITLTGTAAAHTIRVCAAHADTDHDFVGDGATVNVSVGCIDVRANNSPGIYIPTTTAAVTRTVENLRYPGLANVDMMVGSAKQGAMRCKVLAALAIPPAVESALVGINDGGSASDRILLDVMTDGTLKVYLDATGGSAQTALHATNVCNGALHDVVLTWGNRSLQLWVDGVPGTATACVQADYPDELDRITIGENEAGALQSGVLVADVKLFNIPTTRIGSGWR